MQWMQYFYIWMSKYLFEENIYLAFIFYFSNCSFNWKTSLENDYWQDLFLWWGFAFNEVWSFWYSFWHSSSLSLLTHTHSESCCVLTDILIILWFGFEAWKWLFYILYFCPSGLWIPWLVSSSIFFFSFLFFQGWFVYSCLRCWEWSIVWLIVTLPDDLSSRRTLKCIGQDLF